ncbi:thioredoxin family protein [Leucobacter triazinivorans]|uniref:Thioredoxin n=1 Tax=Leucobacter triazinivorans TaxID=1784719 RepID=A0A4V0Z1Q6_9MICO|nr:thioredoxin family protein [Leucobacter triazinivorans]QBE49239.1 thioredoxin [Leucobacter triazinivorans]
MRKTTGGSILALACAAALMLAGCGTQTDAGSAAGPGDPDSATTQPLAPTDDAANDAADDDAVGDAAGDGPGDDSPASESDDDSGAYLAYTDGIIERTDGPKALFFHASWCPQCRALDEDLRANGAPDGLTVFQVDYDGRTDLRQRYGVTLQTTIVFVDDDGREISKAVLYDDPSVASLRGAMP